MLISSTDSRDKLLLQRAKMFNKQNTVAGTTMQNKTSVILNKNEHLFQQNEGFGR